jgi:cyclase
MLKIRVIPILTFNGFALVKTKEFKNPRMLGNPIQSARVFNQRGVDELIFLDIQATKQKRKINLNIVKEVIKECFMPVGIGGGINTIDDINDLLRIGADKVIIKTAALSNPDFVIEAANFFGSQCITIAIDVIKRNEEYYIQNELGLDIKALDFIQLMEINGAGELIVNSVDNDGKMNGFDIDLIRFVEKNTKIPIVAVGGAGNMNHINDLFTKTSIGAVGASSIFSYTQHTPKDIKLEIQTIGKPVRLNS